MVCSPRRVVTRVNFVLIGFNDSNGSSVSIVSSDCNVVNEYNPTNNVSYLIGLRGPVQKSTKVGLTQQGGGGPDKPTLD